MLFKGLLDILDLLMDRYRSTNDFQVQLLTLIIAPFIHIFFYVDFYLITPFFFWILLIFHPHTVFLVLTFFFQIFFTSDTIICFLHYFLLFTHWLFNFFKILIDMFCNSSTGNNSILSFSDFLLITSDIYIIDLFVISPAASYKYLNPFILRFLNIFD